MEHIVVAIDEICKKNQYVSCKSFAELLDARLPYNLFIMKLTAIVKDMLNEARKQSQLDDCKILEGIIGDLESSLEYDV
jgi:hypothetical protein